MLNTLLGSKGKMGQTYVGDTRVPVTMVKVGPCVVTQVKHEKRDGYWAIQLGFGDKRIKNVTQPMQGHLRGVITNKTAPRFLREVRLNEEPKFKVGDVINVSDIFKRGDEIRVTGTSKGKGFAGVMKRWGFAGGPRTHGQSDRQRAPGSIGQGTTPGRVHKGKKMPGRMGTDKVTIKNLIVTDVNKDENMIAVSGPIPGVIGGLIRIVKTGSGKLKDLIEEAPQQQVVEGEAEEEGEENSESESMSAREGSSEKSGNDNKEK